MAFTSGLPELSGTLVELRLPRRADYIAWVTTRREGVDFLQKWEPIRGRDYEARASFFSRLSFARRAAKAKTAFPFMIFRREDSLLLGAITLDNVRYGPARAGTVGYWIGPEFARQGYMNEALSLVRNFAFSALDISRIEAACLPENKASRGLLEKTGFKYEGVAQSYLQIAGRWRTHVLYACLRGDRRGQADAE
ncbi:MAG: GNAT family N-acetyltransferase [Rhodobacteraceae bacterium]|nr:GNAT family N-acetyltransferase [Paracoccaceae bacterium]